MTNFATAWKAPKPKAPPRKYLNAAGSPLTLCSYHGPGQWLLTFADQSTRITKIRPTSEMVRIHNETVRKNARKASEASPPSVALTVADDRT